MQTHPLNLSPEVASEFIRWQLKTFFDQVNFSLDNDVPMLGEMNKQQHDRAKQKTIRVYLTERGTFILSFDNARYSDCTREFIQALQVHCIASASLRGESIAYWLASYQQPNIIFPALDTELVQAMVGIKVENRPTCSDFSKLHDSSSASNAINTSRGSDASNEGLSPYRFLLFVPDKVTMQEIHHFLQSQNSLPHEVILYQSSAFPRPLSLCERCDNISAYPEYATWFPVGVASSSFEFNASSSNLNELWRLAAQPITPEDKYDFALYEMQWGLDGLPAHDFKMLPIASVQKLFFDASSLSKMPSIVYSIPRDFACQSSSKHWFFAVSPQDYHNIDSQTWMELLKDPSLAWDLAHMLWNNKTNGISMSYPAGWELTNIIENILDELSFYAGRGRAFDIIASARQKGYVGLKLYSLERYFDLSYSSKVTYKYFYEGFTLDLQESLKPHLTVDSWKFLLLHREAIYENSHFSWRDALRFLKKTADEVKSGDIPYESSKVYRLLAYFLQFLTGFYNLSNDLNIGMLEKSPILACYDRDFFPLLLLSKRNLNFEHDLLHAYLPLVCISLDLDLSAFRENGSMCNLMQTVNHKLKKTLAMPHSKPYLSFLSLNESRYHLLSYLFVMMNNLEKSGGLLSVLSDQFGFEVSERAFTPVQEGDLFRRMLYELFNRECFAHCKAHHYRMHDQGLPSLNDLFRHFVRLFRVRLDKFHPSPMLVGDTKFEYSSDAQSILPIYYQSPLPFFVATAWLNFCFEQYQFNPSAVLGLQGSISHFAKFYLEPKFKVRRFFIEACRREDEWALSMMNELIFVQTAFMRSRNANRLEATFSILPKHLAFFDDLAYKLFSQTLSADQEQVPFRQVAS